VVAGKIKKRRNKMNAKLKNEKLVIELDLQEAKPSASGTTLVVAGTRGRWQTGEKIDGQPLFVIANAFIYPTSESGTGEKKQKAQVSAEKEPKAAVRHEKPAAKVSKRTRKATGQDTNDEDADEY
jgi:hypothetical protein